MRRMAVGIAVALALAGQARADKATAEAAFNAAKQLMAEGKPEQACPKFEYSYKEDPQLGSLLNLADCHEKVGKLATAWAEFRAAAEVAQTKGDRRASYARQRVAKLDARISHLVVHRPASAPDMTVTLDGNDITALVDVDMPVDPGKHVLVGRAAAGTASKTVDVVDEGSHLELTLPAPAPREPEVAPPQAPPPPTTAVVAHARPRVEPAAPDELAIARSHRHKLALITGAGGLVLAGVGLYFGQTAFDDWDASRQYCDASNNCQQPGRDHIDSAKTEALASDVFVGAGALAVAFGAYLWVTAPEHATSRVAVAPLVSPGLAGATVRAQF